MTGQPLNAGTGLLSTPLPGSHVLVSGNQTYFWRFFSPGSLPLVLFSNEPVCMVEAPSMVFLHIASVFILLDTNSGASH